LLKNVEFKQISAACVVPAGDQQDNTLTQEEHCSEPVQASNRTREWQAQSALFDFAFKTHLRPLYEIEKDFHGIYLYCAAPG